MDSCNSASNKTPSSSAGPNQTNLEPDVYNASGDITGTVNVPEFITYCAANNYKRDAPSKNPYLPPDSYIYGFRNDNPNTPETAECTDNIAPEEIKERIQQIIVSLLDFYSTAADLDDYCFKVMTRRLISFQEIGLLLYGIISEIKKLPKENHANEICMEDDPQLLDTLNNFRCIEFLANKCDIQNVKTLEFLEEKDLLTEEILFSYNKIDETKYNIKRRVADLKSMDIPGIIEAMKGLEKTGVLSGMLLYLLKVIVYECKEITFEISEQVKRMDTRVKESDKIIRRYRDEQSNIENYVEGKNGDNVSSKLKEREIQVKNENVKSKSRICRLEHNTPFCSNCGWRNSWVKAFKKRGVYVKETTSSTNKYSWTNSINDN